MKRFISILAVVCSVFILFGGITALAYSKGDVVDGVTLAKDFSGYDNYISFGTSDDLLLLHNGTSFYVNSSDGMLKDGKWYRVNRSTGSSGTISSFNSYPFNISNVVSCSVDIYDESGRKVFPPPPVPTPTPGLEGITTSLLMMILSEMKPILLGLAVSVIGFLAFRKAWNWLLQNLRTG